MAGIAFMHLFQFVNPNNTKKQLELLLNPKILKSTLGDILTNEGITEHNDLVQYYLQNMDFYFVEYIKAIQQFFSKIEIENDPERIDLLLQQFSKSFYQNNFSHKHYFASYDAVHMLTFATVMLDIEVHLNQEQPQDFEQIQQQFYQNVKGINDGKDFDQKFLDEIVNTIKENQVTHLTDKDLIQIEKVNQFQLMLRILEKISKVSVKAKKITKNQNYKDMILYLVEQYIILINGSFETNINWLSIFSIYSLNIQYKNQVLKFRSSDPKIDFQIAQIVPGQGIRIKQKSNLQFKIEDSLEGDKLNSTLYDNFSKQE
ncbi:Sec7 domain [Pseudocohnilembus persalinus]|uniref:Sec7 domain n=1 Tax=Pseudocohnilembus persalinus TaxID=266149 RepID=A0A0V0QL19_PSEPJ|nr:Sec7 domain [Pseudocohnilembus persalinus]|eukprot:KRX02941.1 Sec7 domain [Pseudocohnilembus persalinus]